MEPSSFQWCPVTRPEAMGTNWNTEGSIRKSGNTVRVTRYWHMFPREAVESPSLEILKR